MEGVSYRNRFEEQSSSRNGMGITALLRQLRDETTTLLRQEVALAKTEMSEKAATYGRNTAYLAVGGAVAYAGALLLLAALSILVSWLFATYVELDTWIAAMLGPAIVGAIVAAIGYALIQKAIATIRSESPMPEKTIETLKEDKQWVQSKVT
jgi:xanthine/uracil permease